MKIRRLWCPIQSKCKRNHRMNKLSDVCLNASVHGFTMPSLLFARSGEKKKEISPFFYSTLYIYIVHKSAYLLNWQLNE